MSYDPNEITGGPSSRDLRRVSPPNVRDEARKIAKSDYLQKLMRKFFGKYSNLTPQQFEAEHSILFDETVDREDGIEPRVYRDFSDRLKERLDTNSGALGERLDRGKSDRLDSGKGDRLGFPPQSDPYSRKQDLIRALIRARQGRPTYGGPR